MDNEIAFIREQIDRQIRPGQGGATTQGSRAPGFGAALGGTIAACVVQRADGARAYALYDRAKYGQQNFGG